MDQVNFLLGLDSSRAERELRRVAALGDNLFSRRGFKINVSTSGLPLGRITGDFDNFRNSLDAATARVAAFTATTSIVYGLAEAFRRLFTESIKLEKQLASIQAILRVSGSDLKALSNDLLSVANATGQSFDVAVEAATEFSRQGLTMNKTLEATNAALTLSRIAGVGAAEAVQNLTAVINTFNAEGLTYQSVLDTIISLDNSFAASASGIADGLKRVGSVASEAGISLKEIASLITVVQQVSARGETVISNGLKTIFTRLNRSRVQETLEEIGVQVRDAAGNFRSQIDILTDLANKQDELSDSQRAFINETVAGVYQINTLQSVLKTLSGEYNLFDKAVQVAGSSAGDTAARLRVLNDTTSTSLQVLRNNLTRTFADIGQQTVLPVIKELTSLSNFVLDFFKSSDVVKSFEGIDTRNLGQQLGEGILDGLSSFLNSSGKIILLSIVGKLIGTVIRDLGKGIVSLSGINQSTLVNKQLQDNVNKAIATGNQALVARLAATDNLITKNILLNRLLEQQNQIGNLNLTDVLVSRGLKANKVVRNKAKGFLPAILKERKDIMNGVGGASRNAEPLIREVNLGKGREKVVVNSDELLIEDYLKSGKDAIFNKDMIREAGGIDALKRLGKVRNFAKGYSFQELVKIYLREQRAFDETAEGNQKFDSTPRGKEFRKQMAAMVSGNFSDRKIRDLIEGSPLRTIQRGPSQDLSNKDPFVQPRLGGRSPVVAGQDLNAPSDAFESNPNLQGRTQSLKRYSRFRLEENQRKQAAKIQAQLLIEKQEEERSLERANKEQKKLRRQEKLRAIGLGTAIGAPFLAQGAANLISGDSLAGRRGVAGIEAASSGLAIASIAGFGPLGIVVGGLVTTLSFLQKEADAGVKTFDELKKSADSIIASNQEQLNAVQNTIQAQNQLNELIKAGASSTDRAKAREAILSSSSQIRDENVRKILLSGDQSRGAQDQINNFQQGLQQSSRIQEALLVGRKEVEAAQKLRNSTFTTFLENTLGDGAKTPSLSTDSFGTVVNPIIDAIDLTRASSIQAEAAITSLAKGNINAADFFKILGDNLVLSKDNAAIASKEFQILADTFDADNLEALNKYIIAQLRNKQVLTELAKTLTTGETASIQFKKAFDLSIKNLASGFFFENFEKGLRAQAGLDINREIISGRRGTGEISEAEFLREIGKLNVAENDIKFIEQQNEVFKKALDPILKSLETSISVDKQSEILKVVQSLFAGNASLEDVRKAISTVVSNSDETENLLNSISLSNLDVGEQIERLRIERDVGDEKTHALLRLQINQLKPKTADILSGKTDEARAKLLNPERDRQLTKQIEDLNKKIQRAGTSSREGIGLTGRRDALIRQQQIVRQADRDARRFLLGDGSLDSKSAQQEAELQTRDFYQTQATLLKNSLDEINILARKQTGSNRFSQENINRLTSLVGSGDVRGAKSILEENIARTFNLEIKGILDKAFAQLISFDNEKIQTLEIQKPKTINFTDDVTAFRNSQGKSLPPELFNNKPIQELKRVQDSVAQVKESLAGVSNALSNNVLLAEKNRQLLEGSSAARSFLNPSVQAGLTNGFFSRDQFNQLPDRDRFLMNQVGLSPFEKDNFALEFNKKFLEEDLQRKIKTKEEVESKYSEELKRTNDLIKEFLDKTKGQNEEGKNTATAKIEQAIDVLVDVKGVDTKLIADIRSNLTPLIDNRIKEIIKDTFNIAAITKPATNVA